MNNLLKIKKFVAIIIIMMANIDLVSGQNYPSDFLRSTGKIYSVVLVIAIIFIGIVFFLFRLDNKLTKLENHIKNEQ